jgi:hypothetical protein
MERGALRHMLINVQSNLDKKPSQMERGALRQILIHIFNQKHLNKNKSTKMERGALKHMLIGFQS